MRCGGERNTGWERSIFIIIILYDTSARCGITDDSSPNGFAIGVELHFRTIQYWEKSCGERIYRVVHQKDALQNQGKSSW